MLESQYIIIHVVHVADFQFRWNWDRRQKQSKMCKLEKEICTVIMLKKKKKKKEASSNAIQDYRFNKKIIVQTVILQRKKS